ncbi:sensor histidine kinase [Pseudonocardia lacus]|uniref:sensor histidine kinase n=1 Tax=Pseudonocardia lacus TaxID=2835865 RepID=UPI001BDC32CB|nr:sensor histidine kinase [Pseudonocardia lacus]
MIRPRPRPAPLWYPCTAAVAAFLVIALAQDASAGHAVPLLVAFFAATASGAALPLSIPAPYAGALLQCAASGVLAWSGHTAPGQLWPLSTVSIVTVVGQVGLVAALHHWRTAVAVWWGTSLACMLLVVLDPGGREAGHAGPALVAYTGSALLVLIAVVSYRQRARIRRDLADARRDVEVAQARRALVEERTRIARELHDVVAHSMSVVHMQATSARYRLPYLDDAARAEFADIAAGARSAMGEMRRLLGVLRADDAEPGGQVTVGLAPAPGMAELAALVHDADRRGAPARLAVAPDLPPVSDTIGTTVYRIVQEALSNAVRHAPGAEAAVAIGTDAEYLVVTVENGPGTAPWAPPPADTTGSTRTRHGLVGMRERAELLGGSVTSGPDPDGGFRVTARLPLSPAPGSTA